MFAVITAHPFPFPIQRVTVDSAETASNSAKFVTQNDTMLTDMANGDVPSGSHFCDDIQCLVYHRKLQWLILIFQP